MLSNQLEEANSNIAEVNNRNAQIQSQLNDRNNQVQLLTADKKSQGEQISNLQRDLRACQGKEPDKMATRITELTKQLADKTTENNRMSGDLNRCNNKIPKLQAQIDKQKTTIETQRTKIRQLEASKNGAPKVPADYEDLKARVSSLEDEKSTLEDEKSNLEQSLATTTSNLERERESRQELEQQVTQQTNLGTLYKAEADKFKKERDEALADKSRLDKRIKLVDEIISDIPGAVEEGVTIELTQYENTGLLSEEERRVFESIDKDLETYTNQKEECAALKTQSTAKDEQITRLTNQTTSKDEQIRQLTAQLAAKDAQINQLTSKDEQIQQLTTQLTDKDNQINQLTTQITDKDNQITQLTNQATSKDVQIQELTAQSETNRKDKEECSAALAEANNEIAKLKTQTSTSSGRKPLPPRPRPRPKGQPEEVDVDELTALRIYKEQAEEFIGNIGNPDIDMDKFSALNQDHINKYINGMTRMRAEYDKMKKELDELTSEVAKELREKLAAVAVEMKCEFEFKACKEL